MFRFRCAPIMQAPGFFEFLSEKTRRCVHDSQWVRRHSPDTTGQVEVYLCEAFGGASPAELQQLISAIEATGAFTILVWSDDWPFTLPPGSRCLLFDVNAPSPRTACYGWQVGTFGPDRLAGWEPFDRRPILASFIGSRNSHPIRALLFEPALTSRFDVLIEAIDWWGIARDDTEARVARFAEILARSKFALCPRGLGPSSIRRWEAAYSGAIPVLVDDHTRPFGVDMPGLAFRAAAGISPQENATDLLRLILEAVPRGRRLQDDLRHCLATEFDSPPAFAWHTATGRIVDIANRYWVAGQGFDLAPQAVTTGSSPCC